MGKSFFIIFVSLTTYFLLGAIAGLFLYESSLGLNTIRILKEVAQGVFTAFILRASLLLFYNFHLVRKFFYTFIVLWTIRVIIDISLLGEPYLTEKGTIDWSVDPSVFLMNGLLQGAVFMFCGYLFLKKAKEHWDNKLFRVRTLFIATAVLVASSVVILPTFISIPGESEMGHALALILLIVGLSIREENI